MHLTMWYNVHTRYRLLHLCDVTRTFTSGCLQHCKGAKYTLHCFQSRIFFGMEVWNGIWKKILVWNGIWKWRFLVWNGNGMEEKCKFGIWKNRLPFHTMPCWSVCILFGFVGKSFVRLGYRDRLPTKHPTNWVLPPFLLQYLLGSERNDLAPSKPTWSAGVQRRGFSQVLHHQQLPFGLRRNPAVALQIARPSCTCRCA